MTKRKKIRIISYVSFAVFCALLYFYLLNSQLTYYKRVSNNNYQRAFAEFVTNFDEMNTALEKSKYASSPQMLSTMCTQVYGKAQSAQMALGVLPFSDDALGETSSFISRVGDYSLTLSGTAASGDVEDSTFELLSALSDVSSEITAELRNMYNDMSRSSLTITDMASQDAQISNMDKNDIDTSLLDNFKEVEGNFPEVPSLIYDGPFSDDVDTGSYSLIENEPEVSEEEALNIAKGTLGIDDLRPSGTTEGKVKLYNMSNDTVRVSITAKGGLIYSVKTNEDILSQVLSPNEAIRKGSAYISELGYKDMQATYYIIQDNCILINYAYYTDGYMCYPDLVKARVSLSDGKVLDIDAAGYIRNHKARDIPDEKFDISYGRSTVPSSLKILSESRAVIPSYGKKEIFAFEYKCENEDGKHYIIYVGTQSGRQENILILIEDENGTLTM